MFLRSQYKSSKISPLSVQTTSETSNISSQAECHLNYISLSIVKNYHYGIIENNTNSIISGHMIHSACSCTIYLFVCGQFTLWHERVQIQTSEKFPQIGIMDLMLFEFVSMLHLFSRGNILILSPTSLLFAHNHLYHYQMSDIFQNHQVDYFELQHQMYIRHLNLHCQYLMYDPYI